MKSKAMSRAVKTETLSKLRNFSEESIHEVLKGNNYYFNFDELLSIDNPYIDDISLKKFYTQFENNRNNEFELAKIIYESLPMTREQAANNRYWTYMNLHAFFRYIKYRLIIRRNEISNVRPDDFYRFFLIMQPSQNAFITSPVAGLWWSVQLTIDHNHPTDIYHYTKIFLSERNIREVSFGTHRLSRDKRTLHAMLDFYSTNKGATMNGEYIGSEVMAKQISRTLNQIGGLTLLSLLTKEEIVEKLNLYKETIKQRAFEEKLGKVVSRKKMEKKMGQEETDNLHLSRVASSVDHAIVYNTSSRQSQRNPLKVLSINRSGIYILEDKRENDFEYYANIYNEDKNGHLLMCYEEGHINRVTIESLLQKNRSSYQNGLYWYQKEGRFFKIKNLFVVNEPLLIGIFYKENRLQYFKMHEIDKFKENNSSLSLRGYKLLYMPFDKGSVEYHLLPYHLYRDAYRLYKKSFTASGIEVDHPSYRKEFEVLSKYIK